MNNNYGNKINFNTIHSPTFIQDYSHLSSINSPYDQYAARHWPGNDSYFFGNAFSPINSNAIPMARGACLAFEAKAVSDATQIRNTVSTPATLSQASKDISENLPQPSFAVMRNPTKTYPRYKVPAPNNKKSPLPLLQQNVRERLKSGPIRRPLPTQMFSPSSPHSSPKMRGRLAGNAVGNSLFQRALPAEDPPPPYTRHATTEKTKRTIFLCCLSCRQHKQQ